MKLDLEEIGISGTRWIVGNKRPLVYIGFLTLAIWLLVQMREVMFLLILSYFIAVLVEPAIRVLSSSVLGRAGAILLIMLCAFICIAIFFFGVFPPVVKQYAQLLVLIPEYFDRLLVWIAKLLHNLGVREPDNASELAQWVRRVAGEMGPEQLKKIGGNILDFLLQGYSVTLTLLNLALLPIFVFYISVELVGINRFMVNFFPETMREKISGLAREILDQIYAFFRGQLTVSALMAILYAVGLSLIGVQAGLAIGLLAGILNIVPYLGLLSGLLLSFLSVTLSEPRFLLFVYVVLVFTTVQMIEGFYLTPKIVGSKTGIHPLGVMVALLIGGQLLGILGLVIAIPAAAAARVIFRFLWAEVKEGNSLKFQP